jgi:hypothetical protein
MDATLIVADDMVLIVAEHMTETVAFPPGDGVRRISRALIAISVAMLSDKPRRPAKSCSATAMSATTC